MKVIAFLPLAELFRVHDGVGTSFYFAIFASFFGADSSQKTVFFSLPIGVAVARHDRTMQDNSKGSKRDPLDLYDDDEEDIPAHLSQFMESTDLSEPIFLLADDEELEDPLKMDDPTLSAMLTGTIDWTTDEFTIEDTPDPFKDVQRTDTPERSPAPERKEEDSLPHPGDENKGEADVTQEAQEAEKGEAEEQIEKEKELELEVEPAPEVTTESINQQPESSEYQEEVKARFRGELMRQSVDMAKLRNLCKTYGIPDALRGDIWKVASVTKPTQMINFVFVVSARRRKAACQSHEWVVAWTRFSRSSRTFRCLCKYAPRIETYELFVLNQIAIDPFVSND